MWQTLNETAARCVLVVVLSVAVVVEGVVVQTPQPSRHPVTENCTYWIQAIPAHPLLSLRYFASPATHTSMQPLSSLNKHTYTPVTQPAVTTTQPVFTTAQLTVTAIQPALTTTQFPFTTTQQNSYSVTEEIPKVLTKLPSALELIVSNQLSAQASKLPTSITELPQPIATKVELHRYITPSTVTHPPPQSPLTPHPGNVTQAPTTPIKLPPLLRTLSLIPATTVTQPASLPAFITEPLSRPELSTRPPTTSVPADSQLPAPTTTPSLPVTTNLPSAALDKMLDRLQEVLSVLTLPSRTSQLFFKPYMERFRFANHEMVDRVLQEPLNATNGQEGSGVNCSLQELESRLSELQHIVGLILLPLPQSVLEVQEFAFNPELENYLFRPEQKSVLDVHTCRECYGLDPDGYCRQLFFCKGGQNAAVIHRMLAG